MIICPHPKLKIKFGLVLCLVVIFCTRELHAQDIHVWGKWKKWGDNGNGTYNNPILPADYSDVDCIRVGTEYYAVSSTFQYSPGFVILHSKDLVNWRVIGHAVNNLNEISPEMNWDKMNRYGRGIWAGAIRYHDKKFWIYFGTPDEGYFMTTAEDPVGPWSPLHRVLDLKGWDDCSPFWDDNGQGYLVGTNFSGDYKIHLFKLSTDGTSLVKNSDKVIHQSEGSEANKLYKINGFYYHLFSEVKPEGRVLMMERAKNIYGPYTETKQLNHAQREFYEPNQGGLVQTPKGEWYFLTHHGTGDWSGRVLSLLPVKWVGGWPIIGRVGKDNIGTMVWSGKKLVDTGGPFALQTSDDFSGTTLQPQWEWNYQPRSGKWSLTEEPGWLGLYAYKPIEPNNLLKAGNTLTQRTYRARKNTVTLKLDVSKMVNGQKAGLAHFGSPAYAAIGITRYKNINRLEFNVKGHIETGPVLKGNDVWLRSKWGLDGKSRFYFSTDNKYYSAFGTTYQFQWGSYRGDRIAIYNYNNLSDSGYIAVDYLHYQYSK